MKLFIGLLIIAAGAGAFFFLRNKKPGNNNTVQKELLPGQWRLQSIDLTASDSAALTDFFKISLDSGNSQDIYDIKENGDILQSGARSGVTDTSRYEWNSQGELLWTENPGDSSDSFVVVKLIRDSLLLQSKDSAQFLFTRMK